MLYLCSVIDEKLDIEIKNYIIGNNGKVMPGRTNPIILGKRGYYDYLLQRYSDNTTTGMSETVYRLVNGVEEVPHCPVCGKPIVFKNKSYSNWCSPKCRNNDPAVLAKNKAGVSASLKRVYAERKEEIQKKRAETLKERYGCSSDSGSPFSVSSFQDKAKETITERYGTDNVFRLDEFRKTKETSRRLSVALWKERGLDIKYTNRDTIIIHNACEEHGDAELSLSDFNNRTKEERLTGSCLCPICHPINYYSGEERAMKDFLESNGIEYVANDRNVIKPLELDFYIPSKNIAIEMNGIYFHSELYGKPCDYHKMKTEFCEEKGIQLIHIWEDDWLKKRDIVLSLLKSKLGITDRKIYARNCVVGEVGPADAKQFCEENHMQGYVNSSYKYGLYYKGELVSLMTFGKSRPILNSDTSEESCELYRFCNKLNTSVVGGASKLFEYAKTKLKEDGINEITTFAKRDISNGNLYRKLGFEFVGNTVPNYFYCGVNKPRLTRYECMKHKLVEKFGETDMTEEEIMRKQGYYKCYDSGNIKFRMFI